MQNPFSLLPFRAASLHPRLAVLPAVAARPHPPSRADCRGTEPGKSGPGSAAEESGEPVALSFARFYEEFYAAPRSSGGAGTATAAEEVRSVIKAFIDYRDLLGQGAGPADALLGVKTLYKLYFHNGAMETAEAAGQTDMAGRHWKTVQECWKTYLYAVYLDDACHPDRQPRVGWQLRIRLWWRQVHAPATRPAALPGRASTLVWMVDSIHEQLTIILRRSSRSLRAPQPDNGERKSGS